MNRPLLWVSFLIMATTQVSSACDINECQKKWNQILFSTIMDGPDVQIENENMLKAAEVASNFKTVCSCFAQERPAMVNPKLDPILPTLGARIAAYKTRSTQKQPPATPVEASGPVQSAAGVESIASEIAKISPVKSSELKAAHSEFTKGNVFKGTVLANDYCANTGGVPIVKKGCDILANEVRKVGRGKVSEDDIVRDSRHIEAVREKVTDLKQYKYAKATVAEFRKKYGPLPVLDRIEKEADAKLPGFQAKIAKAEAQKKADLAKAEADQAAARAKYQKQEADARQQVAKENSPACKVARKKWEYCTTLVAVERLQIILDEENEVLAASGTVKPKVINDLTRGKLQQEKAARFIASEFKDMTGVDLGPADCRVKRKPGKTRDEAILEESVAKALDGEKLKHCGKVEVW